MKVTARTLIYDAYRALGVLRAGQGPNDDAVDDGFRALNDMIDSWALESLMVYGVEPTVHPLTGGVGAYTLGPGGTLGFTRPIRVEAAGVTYDGAAGETPIAVLTLQEYRRLVSGVYIDSAYPTANVTLYPVPQHNGQLTLYSWVPLSAFAQLDTAYDVPQGYAKALRWNLALEVAPYASYAAKIPNILYDRIQTAAIESKAAVKSFHSTPPPEMKLPAGLGCGGCYDICNDTFR